MGCAWEQDARAAAKWLLARRLTPEAAWSSGEANRELPPCAAWVVGMMARTKTAPEEYVRPPRRGRPRPGERARIAGACPRCGGTAELLQLCPVSSPVWRTQLACERDGCAWHGKSKLPIDALEAMGAETMKRHVTEG